MASLQGKIIALTGAGSGMGLASAHILAGRGAILALADINEKALDAALKSLPGDKHIADVVDVRNGQQVIAWIEKIAKTLGKLDGAANVAGVCRDPCAIVDESDDTWNFTVDVNAKGIFNCLRAQLRHMNDGGSIVNIASVGGLVGRPNFSVYTASKFAVVGITRAASREAGERNIRVNAVCPGTINTTMTTNIEAKDSNFQPQNEQALKRAAQPEEVGRVIAFLLSDEASFVTGAIYPVDGGWVA